jgi:hypothetical protein
MKIKAKELVKRFIKIESLKDFGGMDPDLAKECAKIAMQYHYYFLATRAAKIETYAQKIDKMNTKKQPVNYAKKEAKQ